MVAASGFFLCLCWLQQDPARTSPLSNPQSILMLHECFLDGVFTMDYYSRGTNFFPPLGKKRSVSDFDGETICLFCGYRVLDFVPGGGKVEALSVSILMAGQTMRLDSVRVGIELEAVFSRFVLILHDG